MLDRSSTLASQFGLGCCCLPEIQKPHGPDPSTGQPHAAPTNRDPARWTVGPLLQARPMPKFIDISGQKFGLWTVLERVPMHRRTVWKCQCDCGSVSIVPSDALRGGISKSCGCLHRGHGMSGTLEHDIWVQMRRRCSNPADSRYFRYGARGISVCPEWSASFEAFYADMGPRPSADHSLDRIDNDGPYAPWNCRWALPPVQQNNRRDNRRVTYKGETKALGEWAKSLPFGISLNTLYYRIYKKNWSVERAFTEPVHPARAWAGRTPQNPPQIGEPTP